MSRITPVDHPSAQGRPKQLLDAVTALLGVAPNMTTTMARSAVLEGWLGLNGALRKGSISPANGERIALAVAEANGCTYCLSAHSYLATNVAKLDADELHKARRFQSSDPQAAAILAFAEAVVHTKGGVSDGHIRAARDAGLTDAELGDIVGHVAINVLTNYFNKAFDVDVDFPVVEPHNDALAA
ncbi:MAG TPA: carboxymuconolactone decarboxylase family protein [Acidimicrobiales bacterium]|nr:carboxymuconolactone decarboxylase family protein [Acidimicrobiales bacterium]